VLLLILCLGSTRIFVRRQEQTLDLARAACQAAEAGNSDLAREKTGEARQHWDRNHRFSAVLTDHSALENVDEAFVQVNGSREPEDYYRLFRALELLIREHRLTLENIF
jgi:hypothetical protein